MTTSKRTTRGGSRPDNGAANASTPPLSAAPAGGSAQGASPSGGAPAEARVRHRKSAPRSTQAAHSTAQTTAAPVDRYASIAQAAYFRSQHRGFKPGHEMEDWLAAEEEVDQRLRGQGRVSGD